MLILKVGVPSNKRSVNKWQVVHEPWMLHSSLVRNKSEVYDNEVHKRWSTGFRWLKSNGPITDDDDDVEFNVVIHVNLYSCEICYWHQWPKTLYDDQS